MNGHPISLHNLILHLTGQGGFILKLADFDYHLPKHLIAQRPARPRDSSRLMVLTKDGIQHRTFSDLPEYVQEGDVLVINESKVIPVRLFGSKETGGKIEALLVKKKKGTIWECLISGKNVRNGTSLIFGDRLHGVVNNEIEGGRFEVEFPQEEDVENIIRSIGVMPTPPYIKEILKEPDFYQTVYAKENGSIAAPTAGLHFTPRLLEELQEKGVGIVPITLHVSIGTFLPVRTTDVEEHTMEPEYFRIGSEAAAKITRAKENGNRIIAVGTTTLKTLESACGETGEFRETEGESDLFIYPGYEFRAGIHALLTNFHLPKSTLIMLVSAYAGRDRILEAYQAAIEHTYRFYSFGDAMLIER
jgi:S-adenosylmethionine:tRNA ribosyltransferase-isomerase